MRYRGRATRRGRGDIYPVPLLARSCVNNENGEENFWANRKDTRTPPPPGYLSPIELATLASAFSTREFSKLTKGIDHRESWRENPAAYETNPARK